MNLTTRTHARRALLTLGGSLALLGPASAAMVDFSNAANVSVHVRDCRSAAARAANSLAPDLCEASADYAFASTRTSTSYSGSLGGLTASVSSVDPLAQSPTGGGASRASVDASGDFGTLVLRQGAFTSQPYARVSAHTNALQSFTWDGVTGSANRTIRGSVDFTATAFGAPHLPDAASSSAPASFLNAAINVFSLATPSFAIDTEDYFPQSIVDFDSYAQARTDYRSEATSLLTGAENGSPLVWELSFVMEAERTYFVDSWLGVWAVFGAELDATHTFTSTWGRTDATGFVADFSGLTAAAASPNPYVDQTVATPGTLWLVLLAGGAATVHRNQRAMGRSNARALFSVPNKQLS